MIELMITKQAKYYVLRDYLSKEDGKIFRSYEQFVKYMNETYNIEECFINTEYTNYGGLIVYTY